MWKCPKCGRTFKNENQSSIAAEKLGETVDDYINAQDEEIHDQLQKVRHIAFQHCQCSEKISWSMPTYWKVIICSLLTQKKHIGLYPGILRLYLFL